LGNPSRTRGKIIQISLGLVKRNAGILLQIFNRFGFLAQKLLG